MALFDLKSLNSALDELQAERGITRESVIDALATALAAAYRREYGKRGQIIRATFNRLFPLYFFLVYKHH
jgi:hypothetical protein